jgi:hypothetical protein
VENIQKTDATIEGIRGYERTKIGTIKKISIQFRGGKGTEGKNLGHPGYDRETKKSHVCE